MRKNNNKIPTFKIKSKSLQKLKTKMNPLRHLFPVLDQCLYLNTAYTAPLSRPLFDWFSKEDQQFLAHGDQYKIVDEKQYYLAAQHALAKFVGNAIDHTFITGNFSSAFQNFILHLPKGSRFLMLSEEYPSLTGLVNHHGFDFDEVNITVDVEQKVWDALHRKSYDVFALSAIQYSTGLFFDMQWLKKIKKAFPNLILLVDGTQFIGAEEFDFEGSGIDGLFGSSYKWLLSAHGTGYAIIRKGVTQDIGISTKTLQTSYNRGQLSIKALGSLPIAIEMLESCGFKQLIQSKAGLTQTLKKELQSRGLLDQMVAHRKTHSSIFNLPLSEQEYQGLLKNNVRCIQRGKGVRIAVHAYNIPEDIKQFFTILDSLR